MKGGTGAADRVVSDRSVEIVDRQQSTTTKEKIYQGHGLDLHFDLNF